MSSEEVVNALEANAAVLGIAIRPEWMPNVVKFYEIAEQMARDVIDSGALTDVEAATIFTPRSATDLA